MNEQSVVVEFYRRELARALDEQSFGVTHSEITHFSKNEAEATITLLEGQTVNVALSSAGYKVREILSNDTEEIYYETLDNLLSFISPSYATKRVEALMERLQGLVGSDEGMHMPICYAAVPLKPPRLEEISGRSSSRG
ncbi:hypothetical protein EDB84DRAFT_1259436 [Lactarius hengduanensis]|nr:hypothetical protein EDB84DRAFT_1259436 [Lactarius hengduanensis]